MYVRLYTCINMLKLVVIWFILILIGTSVHLQSSLCMCVCVCAKRSILNYAISIVSCIVQIMFKLLNCENGKYALTFLLRLKLNVNILIVQLLVSVRSIITCVCIQTLVFLEEQMSCQKKKNKRKKYKLSVKYM